MAKIYSRVDGLTLFLLKFTVVLVFALLGYIYADVFFHNVIVTILVTCAGVCIGISYFEMIDKNL